MLKTIGIMMVVTVLSKVLGFARELILSFYFGTGNISDAYLISQTIPGVIFQFVGTGLTTCFIPLFIQLKERDKKLSDSFTCKVATLVLIFSIFIICITELFAPYIIRLFASGFTDETNELASFFLKTSIPSVLFACFVYVYNSYLTANQKFEIVSIAIIPNTICLIASIFAAYYWDKMALSIGSILAMCFQLFAILPTTRKLGFTYKQDFQFKDENLRKLATLLLPVIVGVSVNEINVLIDKTISSQVAVGAISALTYANSIVMLAQGGISQVLATVCYPQMAEMLSRGQLTDAERTLKNYISIIVFILLPITVLFLLQSEEIVGFLFARGAFDQDALYMTKDAFVFYAVGLPFLGMREITSRYFYSNSETKIPTKNSVIGLICNIILNLLLYRGMGVGGLALATSLSALITTIFLIYDLKKKEFCKNLPIDYKELGKVLLGSIIMGAAIILMKKIVFADDFLKLAISTAISLTVYLFITVVGLKSSSLNVIKQKKRKQ